MTRDEYVALIKKRLDRHGLETRPGIRTDLIAEDLAAHIWSPMEIAKAVQELAVNSNLSFHEAMRVMSDFIKADGQDTPFIPDAAWEAAKTLVIQPGDKLVVRVPPLTSQDIMARMTNRVQG